MGVHTAKQIEQIDVSGRSPVVDACKGCENIIEVDGTSYCKSYASPESIWMLGDCPIATHIERVELSKTQTKTRNPLKASKKAARGR